MIVALVATGCGEVADRTQRGPDLECETTTRGTLLLFAQAVPTAGEIPCLDTLPPGWDLIDVEATSDGGVIDLSNATYDTTVRARFLTSCTPIGPSAKPRVVVPLAGTACLDVVADDPMPLEALDEFLGSIDFISRDELRRRSGWEL